MNVVALAAGVLVAALAGPWLAGEIRSLPRGASLASRADQRVVSLDVGGMTCVACVAAVQGSLEQVRGVSTVDVRLREHRAFIVCDRGVPDSSLTAAVHRAGPGFLAAVDP
jgi:copper chaperone CopZ